MFFVLFRVKWRLKDIDWPTCMSYIEFVYYDTVYNESVFIHTYDGPFVDKMEFELLNTQVTRRLYHCNLNEQLNDFKFFPRFLAMRSMPM